MMPTTATTTTTTTVRRSPTSAPRSRASARVVTARAGKFPAPGDRLYNFSAGPATLPMDVLEDIQRDLVNYKGTGMSVLEMSHRGKDFMEIAAKAESDLRALVGIPENYKVLFLQGGASTMFASNVHNLAGADDCADYVVTGAWSSKAQKEGAKMLAKANVAASSKESNFTTIPDVKDWKLTPGAKFVHICSNETIGGVEFKDVPDVGSSTLVADMSSNYLSKPIDIEKYGIVYGGVQKNIGPAGMGIAIVREDLMGNVRPDTPSMFDYKLMAENDSMYNTPPCFTLYVSGLVFAKLLKDGGLAAMEKRNIEKANVLYGAIDGSGGYYVSPVDPRYRSLMNVPFTLAGGADLEKKFLSEAKAEGFEALKGHRSVGGARASIYNAMPKEGVDALAAFMKDFQARNA
jgi:phosphoserine aminotransferase